MTTILVVDDDAGFRGLLRDILEQQQYRVLDAGDGEAALEILRRSKVDVVVSDQRMPRKSGLDLLREINGMTAPPPVVLMTGYGTIPDAVEAVRLGALDYLTKPLESPDALLEIIDRALAREGDSEIVSTSRTMQELVDTADRVAPRDVPVLIEGESGTGKELFARRIHMKSARAMQPFVAVNCAALPESLAESELFGAERGAFTGADRARSGRFEEAHRGTLFLDEIGELPLTVQAKLLRALEERVIRRLGGSKDVAIDARIIAATNRDLRTSIETGTFRSDLYFRLAVVSLRLPPLRERPNEIASLAQHLTSTLSRRHRLPRVEIEPAAIDALAKYDWPGNVRELRNVLERAVVLRNGGVIRAEDVEVNAAAPPLLQSLHELSEKEAILDALRRAGGKREEAAKALGVSVRTLYYKLRRLGLN